MTTENLALLVGFLRIFNGMTYTIATLQKLVKQGINIVLYAGDAVSAPTHTMPLSWSHTDILIRIISETLSPDSQSRANNYKLQLARRR
jgi:hypothetical protein